MQEERIINTSIEKELRSDFLDYAMSVIVSRALPDIRDGLKPVHRRVIYTMLELNLEHGKSYKKCARIVGDCLGKWHPHGDSSVYNALVRMAQEWSLRYPLIEGQGNFGSIDGDSPAAMRYTEARLQKISAEMITDIDKETVPYRNNFDESLKEPKLLPAKIPNLLINGSSGIAVGMTTSIPPHNLTEVCSSIIATIDNPEITLQELLEHLKGPDFPTGGVLHGTKGMIQAYTTGIGKIKVRGKIDFETSNGRDILIVSEIPYMVNKTDLITEIAEQVKKEVIPDISDLRDESDRKGMRIFIQLKRGANPEVVRNLLYKKTRLEEGSGIRLRALKDDSPKIFTLKQMLEEFIKHRIDIIIKRTTYLLKKAKEKLHILNGILIALENINEVVNKIRKSSNTAEAKNMLMMDYTLTEIQAKAVLDMRLQKLSALERNKITEEQQKLQNEIRNFENILSNKTHVLNMIKEEQRNLIERYGDKRKTSIIETEEDLEIEDLITPQDVVVTQTNTGYIKRIPITEYKQQMRGGKGVRGTGMNDEDFVTHVFVANTHSYLLLFTDKGIVHWLKVYRIPDSTRYSKGKALVNLIDIAKGSKISAIVPVKNFDETRNLVFVTKKGIVKTTQLLAYSRPRATGIWAIKLQEGDTVVDVLKTSGKDEIIIASAFGQSIRFKETNVRRTSRYSMGVKGISLKSEKDEVVGMIIAHQGKTMLTVTENGFGKRTPVEDYRLIYRGGSGVINIKTNQRNGKVVSVLDTDKEDELIFVSLKGQVIRTSCKFISVIGRNTQGVKLMNLSENDKVSDASKINI